jgi:membrane protein implicated in regulation of membrane protease activity
MPAWRFRFIMRGIAFMIVAAIVLGLVVMSLWNALIPAIFGGPTLTFWQAVGILILSHLLFRGWSPWRHANGWRHDRWRERFEHKLAAMSPEEREQFRAEWKHRCGWHAPMDRESEHTSET